MKLQLADITFSKFFLVFALIFVVTQHASAKNPLSLVDNTEKQASTPPPEIPEALSEDNVDAIVSPLTDAQVRRLLIDELKNRAIQESELQRQKTSSETAGIGQRLKGKFKLLEARMYEIATSGSFIQQDNVEEYKKALESEFGWSPSSQVNLKIILKILIVQLLFLVSLFISNMLFRFQWPLRKKIELQPPSSRSQHIYRIGAVFMMEIVSILIHITIISKIFNNLLDSKGIYQLVFGLYMGAFVMVRGSLLLSRLLFLPMAPALRYLPISDEIAIDVHSRISWLVIVGAFSLMTCVLGMLLNMSGILFLGLLASLGLVMVLMISRAIIHFKQPVAAAIGNLSREKGYLQIIAKSWHYIAIFCLYLFWITWIIDFLLDGNDLVFSAIATISAIPLFLIIDALIHRSLAFISGIIQKENFPPNILGHSEDNGLEPQNSHITGNAGAKAESIDSDLTKVGKSSIESAVLNGSRIIVAYLMSLILLWVYGVDIRFGTEVAISTLSVLITILTSYGLWLLAKNAIDGKLNKEMPGQDEKMEEGVSGGSRAGTLLIILQKIILAVLFICVAMVILSTLGVNIRPLIAGAGIVGIAIGFGSQALVKDIISGLFFLLDDAFRVGDYVDTGTVKGLVEKISLRSLQLRHHRGMVHTIPFGDISSVTNFSRDYIISKLDIRVRYDTDIDKVRKIIKKINSEMMSDEGFASKLLDDIKSLGVREMDDSAMIMRIEFKSIPGEQFQLRKEVYQRVQQAFRENGIAFAHKNVTVYLPDDQENQNVSKTKATEHPTDLQQREEMVRAGAAVIASEGTESKGGVVKGD
jgi:small-conductance mechanosensitive channel